MIFLYFGLLILFGVVYKKKQTKDQYLYLSRKITLPSFIATIVTTWYGGILEVGRFTYYNGIVTWIIFCFFYYISAYIFAFYVGPKIHDKNISSIPNYFYKKTDLITGHISSILIFLISSPAPYILILSTLISDIYSISNFSAILISITVSTIYIYTGGLRSVIRTDKFQFILMYVGFIVMLIYLIKDYGGINFLINNIPDSNLDISSNLSFSYILSWLFISFIIIIDPSIFQRTYASNNINIIKKGFTYSIMLWFIFDLMTITVGLYASAIIPITQMNSNPYIMLSDMILPIFWQSVFIITLLAIIMSTIDSTSFVSAITLADIFKKHNNISKIRLVKISLIITSLISFILCSSFTTAIDMWYIFGSIAASALLIPFILFIYIDRYKIKYPSIIILLPAIISIICFLKGDSINIDPIYPGIVSSLLLNYLYGIKKLI